MTREPKSVAEEVTYLLKFRIKQVTAFNQSKAEDVDRLAREVEEAIKVERVPIMYRHSDIEKHRHMVVLETYPDPWAFVSKKTGDKWDYMEELLELAEIYNGREAV